MIMKLASYVKTRKTNKQKETFGVGVEGGGGGGEPYLQDQRKP